MEEVHEFSNEILLLLHAAIIERPYLKLFLNV